MDFSSKTLAAFYGFLMLKALRTVEGYMCLLYNKQSCFQLSWGSIYMIDGTAAASHDLRVPRKAWKSRCIERDGTAASHDLRVPRKAWKSRCIERDGTAASHDLRVPRKAWKRRCIERDGTAASHDLRVPRKAWKRRCTAKEMAQRHRMTCGCRGKREKGVVQRNVNAWAYDFLDFFSFCLDFSSKILDFVWISHQKP